MGRRALVAEVVTLTVACLVAVVPVSAAFAQSARSQAAPHRLEGTVLGGCTAVQDRGKLLVIGDSAANEIEIGGTADGVQVTCDGDASTFVGVEELTVEAGDGDDLVRLDDRPGLLRGIPVHIFGQGGNNAYELALASGIGGIEELPSLHGGVGEDALAISTKPLSDRIAIDPLGDAGSVQVRVTDVATGTPQARVTGSGLESLDVKAGEGDDEIDTVGIPGVALNLLGQGGDDDWHYVATRRYFAYLEASIDRGLQWAVFDGGDGHDKADILATSRDESIAVSGVPDREIPDPLIRMTDLASRVFIDSFVQHTEAIALHGSGGNDRLDVAWNATLMSGLTTLQADLGDGDDTMTTELLPVRTLPEADGPQPARFEVLTGAGDDQLTFSHAAGSWLDVDFIAQLGTGNDRFSVLLSPPPDDTVPGPDGARRVSFELLAGTGDDVVAIENATGGGLLEVIVDAVLGKGDDVFEAAGEMAASADPGSGFDTARVTRNLLRFVAEFERIELLEGGP